MKSFEKYTSFGMPQPQRNYNAPTYRFGFNGKENINEIHNQTGTYIDYGARGRDPRLGCGWWSPDPLTMKYAGWSPYNFTFNSPIYIIDKEGEDSLIVHRTTGEAKNGLMFYKLTFSIVRNGVEETLPYTMEQATLIEKDINGKTIKLIQVPEETDVMLEFQQMSKYSGKKGYENTIRVNIPFEKSEGEEYGVYMHPTFYNPYIFLTGCIVTGEKVTDVGRPTFGNVTNPTPEQQKQASEQALQNIRDMYNLADKTKVRKGEDVGFIMRTSSTAPEPPAPQLTPSYTPEYIWSD